MHSTHNLIQKHCRFTLVISFEKRRKYNESKIKRKRFKQRNIPKGFEKKRVELILTTDLISFPFLSFPSLSQHEIKSIKMMMIMIVIFVWKGVVCISLFQVLPLLCLNCSSFTVFLRKRLLFSASSLGISCNCRSISF